MFDNIFRKASSSRIAKRRNTTRYSVEIVSIPFMWVNNNRAVTFSQNIWSNWRFMVSGRFIAFLSFSAKTNSEGNNSINIVTTFMSCAHFFPNWFYLKQPTFSIPPESNKWISLLDGQCFFKKWNLNVLPRMTSKWMRSKNVMMSNWTRTITTMAVWTQTWFRCLCNFSLELLKRNWSNMCKK